MLTALVEDTAQWTTALHAPPRTLVHNDLNPRNIAVRAERAVVYDWELATVDVPQRDVVELLASTLGPDATEEDVEHALAVHAEAVASVSPQAAALVAGCDWRRGYRLALRTFLTTRLALYLAGHSQREFGFLPRLVETAFRLWHLEEPWRTTEMRAAVVGIDGTGKTTVLRRIREQGDITVVHAIRAHDDPDRPYAALAGASAAADALGRVQLKPAVLYLQLCLYGPAERQAAREGRILVSDRHPLIDPPAYLPMFARAVREDAPGADVEAN
ncbi:phosphotransferase [Streptomyces massasporeus]|uniref:phosphotransferase n=1 Tax=Streptomyces massasporeus TaxID=67324 RepID=UPI0033E649F2